MSRISFRDYFFTLLIALFLLLINLTPLPSKWRSTFVLATAPLRFGFIQMGRGLAGELAFWGHVRELSSRVSRLEAENSELKSQVVGLKEISLENEVLRRELGLTGGARPQQIQARVVSFGGIETASVLALDRGSVDGVKVDSVVVLAGNLVGKVVEVADRTSFVRVVLDDDLKVAALDQDSPNRARGVVRGQYSRLMVMDKILKEEEVKVGDTIITSGEDGTFPHGLVIGTVKSVASGPEGLLKVATLESPLKLNRLETVFIQVK